MINLVAIGELTWLIISCVRVMIVFLCDEIVRCTLGATKVPRGRNQLLIPEVMSRMINRSVASIREKAVKGDVAGVKSTVTTRMWLSLELQETVKQDLKTDDTLNVFVKMPTENFKEEVFMSVFGVIKNEVDFYALLQDENFTRHFPPAMFPKIHHISYERYRFLLVMEDLSVTRRAQFMNMSDLHPMQNIRKVLRCLADLHAPFYGRPPTSVWVCDEVAERLNLPKYLVSAPPNMSLIREHTFEKLEDKLGDQLPARFYQTYALFLKHFALVKREFANGPLTLIHGDAHLANFFFEHAPGLTEDADGLVAGMIDFQCVAVGHPMRDIAYHLTMSCDPDLLNEGEGNTSIEKQLVRFYLKQLAARRHRCRGNGVSDDKESDLSFEDAWEAYRLHAMYGCMAWVVATSVGFLDEEGKVILNRLVAMMDRLKCKERLLELLNEHGVKP